MNLEVIAQLTVLALIVASGPLVIALLAARKGNLWFYKAISENKIAFFFKLLNLRRWSFNKKNQKIIGQKTKIYSIIFLTRV